jgi:nucleoid DNA-binding protein
MAGMSIQERYDDIAAISGLSEEIIRRVYKATRQSVVKSLKKGERATIPGICTFTPELKDKINYKTQDEGNVLTKYIKVKASASPALDTELEKVNNFINAEDEEERLKREEIGMSRLNLINHELPRYNPNSDGVLTTQISALL